MFTDVPTTARLDLIPVADAMHRGVISCTADTPLAEIARILANERIHCVVVSDLRKTEDGQRIEWGIVEERDVVRALAAGTPGADAGRVATMPAVTVRSEDTLAHALARMAAVHASHVVVQERGFPVGILSALDVARAAAAR